MAGMVMENSSTSAQLAGINGISPKNSAQQMDGTIKNCLNLPRFFLSLRLSISIDKIGARKSPQTEPSTVPRKKTTPVEILKCEIIM